MADPVGDIFSRLGISDLLTIDGAGQLGALVDVVAADETAPTTVRDPEESWRVHIADSLSGLRAVADLKPSRIADLGAGAGFPGIVLAIALPETQVALVESVGKKCVFMGNVVDELGLDNAHPVNSRAEELAATKPPAGGRESFDVVTARALTSLPSLVELVSPLLPEGGSLVAWRGGRDGQEEADALLTGEKTAMKPVSVTPVTPYPGSQNRHIHVWSKTGPTPPGLPRRPGMAQKRPLGVSR